MLGLRTKRLINQLLNLHNFSLELERLSSYSHSRRAGAREDTEREVCAGSHRIQFSARGIAGDSTGHIGPVKRYSPLKQENQDLFSDGPQQASAQDKGKQPLHLVHRPGQLVGGRPGLEEDDSRVDN